MVQVPVVAIAFEQEYRDVYGLLRAMIRAGELSQRALWISAEVIMPPVSMTGPCKMCTE